MAEAQAEVAAAGDRGAARAATAQLRWARRLRVPGAGLRAGSAAGGGTSGRQGDPAARPPPPAGRAGVPFPQRPPAQLAAG